MRASSFFVPWHSMLRYFSFMIPLFIVSLIVAMRVFIIPYHYVLWAFMLIISLFGIFQIRKVSKASRLIIFYIIVSLIVEYTAKQFAIIYQDNSPVFHFWIPVQLLFFSLLYFYFLKINSQKTTYWTIVIVLILLSILVSYYKSLWGFFPSNNFIILCSLVFPLSLFFFKKMIKNPVSTRIELQPNFWINIGTFVFFTLVFFILGFHASLKLEVPFWMYDILWGANFLMYLSYFIAIILDSQPKPNQNDSIS